MPEYTKTLFNTLNAWLRLCIVTVGAFGVLGCASITAIDNNVDRPNVAQARSVLAEPTFETRTSKLSFEQTLIRAQAAIDKRGFKTFNVIDHAAGAASIEANLNPTTLIIFGNPKGGTPLMQSAQTMGLALPLKMLVFENTDGTVTLAWPDMAQTFAAHRLSGRDEILAKIEGALAAIAAEASSNQ